MAEASISDDFSNTSPLLSEASSFTDLSMSGEEHPAELIIVDSLFSVVKETFPSLTKLDNSPHYYIPGNLKASDQNILYNYTKRIGQLTLGGKQDSLLASNILVRIARRQDANTPLFPYLWRLRIIDTSSSLDFLDVLLSSSLTRLELTAIAVDDPHYSSVFSFLECAVDEAPNLSTLILGPGRIQDQILQTSLGHKNLRHLELVDVGISITTQLLHDIGLIQHLQSFVLRDNGTSTYTRSPVPAIAPGQNSTIEGQALSPEPSASDAQEVAVVYTEPVETFPALRTLEVRGTFGLIKDLVEKVSPSSNLKVLSFDFLTLPMKTIPVTSDEASSAGRKKLKTASTSQLAPQISTIKIVALLKDSIQKWDKTLVSVSIKNSGKSTFSLPSDVFENLLLHPDLKHLEITGVGIDPNETLSRLKEVAYSKLEVLHLPVHSAGPCISPSVFREIAAACPHLNSLRCRLQNLSDLPISFPLSHHLEKLKVSNEQSQLEQQLFPRIARYLDSIFPNLRSIETCDGDGNIAEKWRSIFDIVEVCQAVRQDELRRNVPSRESEI